MITIELNGDRANIAREALVAYALQCRREAQNCEMWNGTKALAKDWEQLAMQAEAMVTEIDDKRILEQER